MTVKVTQVHADVLLLEAARWGVQVTQSYIEVMGDTPPYAPGGATEFGPQDSYGFSPGGLDLHFTVPGLNSDESLKLRTNVIVDVSTDENGDYEDSGSLVAIENRAGVLWIVVYRYPGLDLVEERKIPWTDPAEDMTYRINFHENHISVYIDWRWAHTFSGPQYVYLTPLVMYLTCTENKTLTNLRITELHDWRHGIFTETEADGMSILQSIVQERPVEMYEKSDGTLEFYYNVDPDPLVVNGIIRSFKEKKSFQPGAASDFILYYRDVDVITDTDYLDEHGFITRILRMSQLDTGAAFAGQINARRQRERHHMYEIIMRPDFMIENGDVITLNVTESGTGTVTTKNIFVEHVSLQVAPGLATMILSGRSHEP